MRKAICPQPFKRINFYSKREEIFNKIKNLCKVISFLVTIFLIRAVLSNLSNDRYFSISFSLIISLNNDSSAIFIPSTFFIFFRSLFKANK